MARFLTALACSCVLLTFGCEDDPDDLLYLRDAGTDAASEPDAGPGHTPDAGARDTGTDDDAG